MSRDVASPRRALEPPYGTVVPIGAALIDQVVAGARVSPRRRMILPLHKRQDHPLQRMLNALQPGTYVRPHRHPAPGAECLVLLRGALRFIAFDDDGEVRRTVDLGPEGDHGVDLEPGVYHSLVALAADSVVLEVKTGPYDPERDKVFADWAPAEDTPDAEGYLRELIARTNPRG